MLKQTLFISNRKARKAARHSRFLYLRKDENQEGGATGGAGGAGGDNQGGNTGQPGNSGENQNNDGQALDLTSFWGSEGEEGQSPNSGSADGSSSSSTGENQPTLKERLGEQLSGMNFEPVMTPEIIEAMANGDPAAFNTGMKSYGQQVAKQTLGMVVGILRDFRAEILGEAQGHVNNTINKNEDFRELVAAIPQADSNHVASKTIRDLYTQSLKNAKGNRKVAIEQTKQVIKLQAEMFGGISGLTVAPQDTSGGNYQPPAKVNWLEELSGR